MPNFEQSTDLIDRSRTLVNGWVARFAPLVMDTEVVDANQLRHHLSVVERLRAEESQLETALECLTTLDDEELVETAKRAQDQIAQVETDFRKRLAKIAPGDPRGVVDLDALQSRLDEREARREIGLETDLVPSILTIKTAPGNVGAAAALGIFGLGWTAFTTVHATLMIGGMFKSFGWIALALLLFYAIFFAVGIGMLTAAFYTACDESIELNGRHLTITRSFGPFSSRKTHEIDPTVPAAICPSGPNSEGRFSPSQRSGGIGILLVTSDGRPVSIAANTAPQVRNQLCDKLNAYLAEHK